MNLTPEEEIYRRKLQFDLTGYKSADLSRVAEWEREDRRNTAKRIIEESGIGEKYKNADLNDLDEFQQETAKFFFEKRKSGLWLCGNVGAGKTTVAAAIGNKLAYDGISYAYRKSHLLIHALRNKEMSLDQVIRNLSAFALVIFDEAGRYPETSWEQYYLFTLVDALYQIGVNVIMISNLDRVALMKFCGEAITDRFKGAAMSREFTNESYRGTDKELYI